MSFKKGAKVKFVEGTTVRRRGRTITPDYNGVYEVAFTNWGRSTVVIPGIGAVTAEQYQLEAA